MRRLAILAGSLTLLVVAPTLPSVGETATAWAQPKHNCAFCHNLHGGSYAALRDTAIVEDLCDSCHGVTEAEPDEILRDGTWVTIPKNNGLGFAIHNGTKHTTPTVCWDCHNHEGEAGTNLSMIQTSMPTPNSGTLPVVFTSRGSDAGGPTLNSFADGDEDADGDYTGVCEVCHTQTDNHGNGRPPDGSNHTHEVGRTCTDCHKHDEGFKGGGPCASCHDTDGQGTKGDKNRRAIIPELSRPSHHVGASYADTDCTTCHDQTKHREGNVRLWNVDSPGDPLASIVLAGDPMASSTEAAKLTTFCLACHDSNGANGNLTPFSDGLTRPLVDATAWSSASHKTVGSLSCFGDGSFGCHASAHGSQKRKLLSPPDVAPTAPANAEEEEGFCFNCHSSTGVANSDIQTAFNQPINWVTQAAGINDNLNLNDRHDVQYAAQFRSGAKIECTDCHNPHVATAALPYKLNPDPGDAHVVGTNYYFYASTSDTLSEFCLDCHDGSFPTSVTDQTTSIVNIQATWGSDQMGGDVGAGNLRPGTGWVVDTIIPCWTCHSPHPVVDEGSTNLYAMVDTVRSTSGAALPGYYDRVQGTWRDTLAYGFSSNVSGAAPRTDGGTWCMTCHNRTSMVTQDNCGNCHRHGDPNGRF